MPRDQPIGVGRFIKQRCAEWKRSIAEDRLGDGKETRISGDRGNGRVIKNMTDAGPATARFEIGHSADERVHFERIQDAGQNSKA
jgi:hypothetical protein